MLWWAETLLRRLATGVDTLNLDASWLKALDDSTGCERARTISRRDPLRALMTLILRQCAEDRAAALHFFNDRMRNLMRIEEYRLVPKDWQAQPGDLEIICKDNGRDFELVKTDATRHRRAADIPLHPFHVPSTNVAESKGLRWEWIQMMPLPASLVVAIFDRFIHWGARFDSKHLRPLSILHRGKRWRTWVELPTPHDARVYFPIAWTEHLPAEPVNNRLSGASSAQSIS